MIAQRGKRMIKSIHHIHFAALFQRAGSQAEAFRELNTVAVVWKLYRIKRPNPLNRGYLCPSPVCFLLLLQEVKSAHGLIGSSVKFIEEMLSGAEHLEAISTISAGYDNFDVPWLTGRGILLTNTPDVLTETVGIAGEHSVTYRDRRAASKKVACG